MQKETANGLCDFDEANKPLVPIQRKNGEWVLKIGQLMSAGKKDCNLATIWPPRNGKIRVEIFEHGHPNYLFWPETGLAEIVQQLSDFYNRKCETTPDC